MVLNRGNASPDRASEKFQGERALMRALQHGKFLTEKAFRPI